MTAHIADQQGWMIIGNITVTYSFPIPLIRCFNMFLLFVFDLFAGGLPWRGQDLIPCSIKGCRWRQISIQVDPARYRSLSFEVSKDSSRLSSPPKSVHDKICTKSQTNSMKDGRHPPDLGECQWPVLSFWDYSEFSHPSPPLRLQRHHLDTWPRSDDTDQNSSRHKKALSKAKILDAFSLIHLCLQCWWDIWKKKKQRNLNWAILILGSDSLTSWSAVLWGDTCNAMHRISKCYPLPVLVRCSTRVLMWSRLQYVSI